MPTPSLLIVPARFKSGKLYSQLPTSGAGDFTVTRATAATRVNASGYIESVASGIPRLDYFASGGTVGCPALLVEPSATNQIRNNSMSGAVTGTPGTLPTNWGSLFFGGLTRQIVATGVINGIQYIDIRLSGTATEAGGSIFFDTITASSGQVWTSSFWFNIISQPNPANGFRFQVQNRLATVFVSDQFATLTPAGFIRYQNTTTVPSGVDNIRPCLNVQLTVSQTYDFTIRIGYPQMELGSVATSVIPTTTGSVTRNADAISVTVASGFIGQTEGTIYLEVDAANAGTQFFRITPGAGSVVQNSIQIYKNSSGIYQARIYPSSSNFNIVDTAAKSGFVKIALAYKSGESALVINGGTPITSATAISFSETLNIVNFAAGVESLKPTYIRAAALYTTRLTNAQLAALTTP